MDEASHEPVMAWQFLLRHLLRIVIGVVLAVAGFFAIGIYATYQREQRITKEIRAFGLVVDNQSNGPDWIPQSLRPHLPFLNRIDGIRSLSSEPQLLTSLDTHSVQEKQVTDADLERLKGLEQLGFLNLNNTQVTDAGLEQLKGLTKLKQLYLFKTQVTDAGLGHLKELTNLTSLGLGKTQVTGLGLEHLKGLTNLTTLDLHLSQVTDADLEHLKGLTNLAILGLDSTQVTYAGLEHLKGLANLSTLYLSTPITEEDMARLRKALPNCNVEHKP